MHSAVFLQDLAIVMIVAAAVTILFHRLRQPVVLGYILGSRAARDALLAEQARKEARAARRAAAKHSPPEPSAPAEDGASPSENDPASPS